MTTTTITNCSGFPDKTLGATLAIVKQHNHAQLLEKFKITEATDTTLTIRKTIWQRYMWWLTKARHWSPEGVWSYNLKNKILWVDPESHFIGWNGVENGKIIYR